MKIGLYFKILDDVLVNYLSHTDLLHSLSQKNITVCIPNWLDYQKQLSTFSNIEYLDPNDFYSLNTFFVFIEDNSIYSSWMKDKKICFVLQGVYIRFSKIASALKQIENDILEHMPSANVSFISHYYKKLQSPFDTLFKKPKTKYRNCYITNDSLVHQAKTWGFDPSHDFIIAYTTTEQQKTTYEHYADVPVSPSNALSSFQQALLAENIFIEPDTYDSLVLQKALKELAFSSAKYSTHNPELKKILDLVQD